MTLQLCEQLSARGGAFQRSAKHPEDRVTEVHGELVGQGLFSDDDKLTPAGRAGADEILSARREELRALADHGDELEPEVTALLERMAVELAGERP